MVSFCLLFRLTGSNSLQTSVGKHSNIPAASMGIGGMVSHICQERDKEEWSHSGGLPSLHMCNFYKYYQVTLSSLHSYQQDMRVTVCIIAVQKYLFHSFFFFLTKSELEYFFTCLSNICGWLAWRTVHIFCPFFFSHIRPIALLIFLGTALIFSGNQSYHS